MAETIEQRLDRLEQDIRNLAANALNLANQSDYKIRRLEGDLEEVRAEIRKLKDEHQAH